MYKFLQIFTKKKIIYLTQYNYIKIVIYDEKIHIIDDREEILCVIPIKDYISNGKIKRSSTRLSPVKIMTQEYNITSNITLIFIKSFPSKPQYHKEGCLNMNYGYIEYILQEINKQLLSYESKRI